MLPSSLLSFILLYGYFAIFVIVFLGSLALPFPSVTVLVIAAAFASQGYFNIWAVILIGIIANILGDNVSYWLVHFYGHRYTHRGRLKEIVTSARFQYFEKYINQHPVITIFFSRFVALLTIIVNVVAAVGPIQYSRYLIWESVGEITAVILYCGVGYFFGADWQTISQFFTHITVLVIAIIAILVFISFQYNDFARKRRQNNK